MFSIERYKIKKIVVIGLRNLKVILYIMQEIFQFVIENFCLL